MNKMKNKDRTIKAATFERLDEQISLAHFELQITAHTISSYFGRNAPLTLAWRSALEDIRRLRLVTKQSFGKKISN
jgi:hypothetical protein